ncbi:MAG: GAF domain-containing sensor histidine kinase, partial [Actinobacteria bacterium]|nr:GAF domain-containing sensor histidine kinase [Actinomycetota bacterium]
GTLRAAPGPLRAGPGEQESQDVRDLLRSVSRLADEAGRLRAEEAERGRLLSLARETGLRIRQHLRVEDLVREAGAAIKENLDADIVYLHLIRDGKVSRPEGHEDDRQPPAGCYDNLPQQAWAGLAELFQRRASLVVQDVREPGPGQLPPPVAGLLREAGVVSHLTTPFGTGSEMLGLIAADRTRAGRPWTPAEVAAVEWIAADVGAGLHHARMYEAENRLVEELTALDRAKSDFLATVSHELRTPLTSIAGYVEMLKDADAPCPASADYRSMLATVERNTARLRTLIEDVLTLSKIESGAFKSTMQPVSLGDIVAGVAAALQPQAEASGVRLTGHAPAGGLVVYGDPGQLDRMLMNLASNAVKFTRGGGLVRITGRESDHTAVVEVSDTGIGIPEADQRQLFGRFFRASNAVSQSIPGTGLGLAIVRTIVANHGGELDLRSAEGDGTTVTVRLTRLASPGGDAPGARAGSGAPAGPGPPRLPLPDFRTRSRPGGRCDPRSG